MLQENTISFDVLDKLDCLYNDQFENDPNVRELWYLICYHLFPKINKNWKQCLEGSRILQQKFLYDAITTSDEAMTLWFIMTWIPKLKEQSELGWPEEIKRSKSRKGIKQGEQELKNGLPDYVRYHALIAQFKDKENGFVACRWNDIFWEELVARNPNLAKKRYNDTAMALTATNAAPEAEKSILILPGIDHKNKNQKVNLLNAYNARKVSKTTMQTENQVTENTGEDSNNIILNHDESNKGNDESKFF